MNRLAASLLSLATLAVAGVTGPAAAAPPGDEVALRVLGTYATGAFDEAAAEIIGYDAARHRAFVVNAMAGTLDVLDLSDPTTPTKVDTLSTPGANCVDVEDGLIAVAVQAPEKTDPGRVLFFDAATLAPRGSVPAGALPDMVTFSPNGQWVLTANEGEPSGYEDGDVDPAGSITVVDLRAGVDNATARTAGFTAWDGREDELRADGVRIFGPGASASQDLEPEYVAVSHDSRRAWVSLQENNAFAIVDIPSATVRDVVPLGLKDHALPENALDADDRDGIAIAPRPVLGMYQPDSVVTTRHRGRTYVVSANEGDAREYDGFEEEVRVKDLTLDQAVFAGAAVPGRLQVTSTSPQGPDGYTALQSFGARSISVWDEDGALVWDSGSALERLVAERDPAHFNSDEDLDNRSDAKGPEPEGLALGSVRGRTYAFVGLERISSIAVFDITDPTAPTVAGYASNRLGGDLGPEGLLFVPGDDSPNGKPLLLVGNEVSGTTTVWQVD